MERCLISLVIQFSSVQSLSRVRLLLTPSIAAYQASLSITKSRSSLRFNIHRVRDAIQPSHPLSSPSPPAPNPLPASESFPMSQLFTWGGQSTGVSASGSFPPKKSQGWSPSGWTGWISLQSKGLSRVFSNTQNTTTTKKRSKQLWTVTATFCGLSYSKINFTISRSIVLLMVKCSMYYKTCLLIDPSIFSSSVKGSQK